MVATYAYVNPVIAVFLGWMIAGESFTSQMLVGASIIVGSVALITSNSAGENAEKEDNQSIHQSQSALTNNCRTASA